MSHRAEALRRLSSQLSKKLPPPSTHFPFVTATPTPLPLPALPFPPPPPFFPHLPPCTPPRPHPPLPTLPLLLEPPKAQASAYHPPERDSGCGLGIRLRTPQSAQRLSVRLSTVVSRPDSEGEGLCRQHTSLLAPGVVPALCLLACPPPPCLGCQALVGKIEENVVWERKGDWRGKIGVLASWRWRGLASTAAQRVAAS